MKCIACNNSFAKPTMQPFETGPLMGPQWKCIAFCCPSCGAVFSAQVDPVALKTDTVSEILELLRRR